MKKFTMAAAFAILAAPAFADGHAATQGDAAAGEAQFNRQCVSCHVVKNAAGDVLAGRSAKTGPNLFGLAGRTIASAEGFRYGDSVLEVGARGDTWTEEAFVGWVQNPTAWVRDTLDNNRARSKMSYRVRDEAQAYDMYAFLATFAE